MKIDIITAFPNAFSFLHESIPKRAQEKEKLELNILDLRKYSDSKWNQIDDRPFGGGAGMVLMIEPIYKALKDLNVYPERTEKTKVLLMGARGENWSQNSAESYADSVDHLVLICGHYEGVDQRVVDNLIDAEVSIGNYILSGGEVAAMVVADSIIRLLPGVVGKEESIIHETSFGKDKKIAEYPHYTRPELFETEEGEVWKAPDILLSGHHANIDKWKEDNKKVISNE